MKTTIPALLDAGSDSDAAVIVGESGTVLTFGELRSRVRDLAETLSARGVERGDRVALVIPDGPDFIQLLFALNALGALAAPLNPAYKHDEYAFYLDDLRPRFLLLPESEMRDARSACQPSTEIVEIAEGPTVGGSGARRAFERAEPGDAALLLHTSGTTSRPKQVPLTHANVTSSVRTITDFYGLTSDDVSYCAMPLFHIHGLVASVWSALAVGGTVVIPRRFTPRGFWRQAREHTVTWFSAGPTLHHMILRRGDDEPALESLRFTRSCSSALSSELMARVEETLRVPILEAYGMTEASHQMSSNPLPPAPRFSGSVGVPTGVEMRIVDGSGNAVPAGAAGEVVIRGEAVMSGYLDNPQANAESFLDGWFRTGDQGRFDNGYLRLEGRLKEMILRGGENISPYEIEDVLKAHPSVEDAVCFGVEDDKYGERVGAAIVLSGEAGERELADHCSERLARFKVPEVIRIVDEIPRTATGKVQRRRVGQVVLGDSG
jgi:acyl-CoA synthetase (AMP-forming)/AMP-acid ligase II